MKADRLARYEIAALLLLAVWPRLAFAADLSTKTLSASSDGTQFVVEIRVPDPVRVEESAGGVEFTLFEFTGMQVEGSPGAPLLPVATRLVAVPPGGSATLRVLESDLEPLGTLLLAPRPIATAEPTRGPGGTTGREMLYEDVVYDATLYEADGPRTDPVRLGERRVLRHQDVVPLEVRPLLYDPATREARRVRRLRVELTLRAGRGSPLDGDAATARLATGRSWERIYAGALLNPVAAAAWRHAPKRVAQIGGPLKSGLLRPGLLAEDEWKIRVDRTGPARVRGTTLLDAGFPGGTPTSSLRLVLKRYDPAQPLDPTILEIPIQIIDVDGDAVFDAEDSFLFYGEDPRTDTTSEDPWARYSQVNVYWLSVAASGTPVRMPMLPPRSSTTPGPTVFDQSIVYEEDHVLNRWVYGSNIETTDSAALYYWTDRVTFARVNVPVPGRAPGAPLQVCVETQEDHIRRPYHLFVRTGSRDSVLLAFNAGTFPPANRSPDRQTTCGTVLDSQIDPGTLRVILQPQFAGGHVPLMDRVRLEYGATYTASGDRIRCTNGDSTGARAFSIGGFTTGALRAFEVSDPKSPDSFDLTGAYAGGTLTLTDSIPDGAERVYVVVPDATIPTLAVELDRPDDILGELATAPVGSYDCLVVAHDAFADDPALARWVAFRQSQGRRIRVVRTGDVYDAFRGGLQHYEAIHRLAQLAFTNWGIEYLMLVGDGSEDAVGLYGDSGPNFVPARVRYFQVTSSSGGEAEYRNDMNDKYYAQVAGSANDPIPDLLLGRLPVGSSAELATVVDKTIAYETPGPGDDQAWRKRVVMFADDEWVIRVVAGAGFRHRRGCSEVGFQRSIEAASDIVDGAFPGDLHAVRYLLRDQSDRLGLPSGTRPPLQPLHRPVPIDSTCYYASLDFGLPTQGQGHPIDFSETGFYQGTAGAALADSVGDGALFLAIQSHMNRVVVCDENILTADNNIVTPEFRNNGKPFVAFGFGCHMNEYAIAREQEESLGESMLLTPSRGAVASYASTGYEFLAPNNSFHEGMWSVVFQKRYNVVVGGSGADSDTLASRWLLSELLEIGEINYADSQMIARYVLLGDPLLRLDAGVPRVSLDRVDNGYLQPDNRLVVRDTSLPIGLEVTFRDEQGIDSLWVVKRLPGPVEVPVDSVTVVALADTAPQITAKRAYRVACRVDIDASNFDIVIGARDLAGRRSEFIGRVAFDQRLVANGVTIQSGDRVDPRTAFRFQLRGYTPIPPPLPLVVQVDGAILPPSQVDLRPDSAFVNWNADFVLDLASGSHTLRFAYKSGSPDSLDFVYRVSTGSFGMGEVIAFPNPMRKQHRLVRIYFHLGEPIAGGYLRVVDLNGRTVLKEDLANPGVVRSDVDVPAGSIGSGVGQDASHWNYVEILRDGRDPHGDAIANGVYLYELYIRGFSGEAQRKRDKIVIMR